MNKSLTILSLSLLLSAAAYGMQTPQAKTISEEKIEKTIVEPGWSTWFSDKKNGVENNVLYELENDIFDARAQGNKKRLHTAITRCINSKQLTTLGKIYNITKRKYIHVEDATLNTKAYEMLTEFKNKQDEELFKSMLEQLTKLCDETNNKIMDIESSLSKQINDIQTTANGVQGTHFQQGVQPKWEDNKKQIIKRKGLVASLAALKTVKEALTKL